MAANHSRADSKAKHARGFRLGHALPDGEQYPAMVHAANYELVCVGCGRTMAVDEEFTYGFPKGRRRDDRRQSYVICTRCRPIGPIRQFKEDAMPNGEWRTNRRPRMTMSSSDRKE